MNQYSEINNILCEKASVRKDKIINAAIYAPDYNLLKLRELLMTKGKVYLELEDKKAYIATIKGGFLNLNHATVAVMLNGDYLLIASYAEEGLINQHTSEGVLNELRESVEQRRK